jgi:hypothetical protein
MTRIPATLRPARIAFAAALAAGGMWVSFGAQAAPTLGAAERSEIQATYRSDRAACLAGHTWQDRDTCLREAVAARRSALRGEFASLPETTYQANALQRCDALPVESRGDCSLRMGNEGVVIGSVESGAIVRELPAAVVAERSAAPTEAAPAATVAMAPAQMSEPTMATDPTEPSSQTSLALSDSSSATAAEPAAETSATASTLGADPATAMPAETAAVSATAQPEATVDTPEALGEPLAPLPAPMIEPVTEPAPAPAIEPVVEPAPPPMIDPATQPQTEAVAAPLPEPSTEATVDELGVITPGLLNGPR